MTIDSKTYVQDVKDELGEEFKGIGKRLWGGMLAAAGSGFGKGVIAFAAIAVVGLAVAWGFAGYAGALQAGAISGTVDEGIAQGLKIVPSFLTSGMGLTFLGIGGAIGAVVDVKKQHGRISAAIARTEAHEYELARKLDHMQETQPYQHHKRTYEFDNPDAHCNHCAHEDQRRLAQAQIAALDTRGV